MDIKKLNQKLQKYDKNLLAEWVKVAVSSPSGFRYMEDTVRVMERGLKSGRFYEIFTVQPNLLREDYIMWRVKQEDSYKGGAKSMDVFLKELDKEDAEVKAKQDAELHDMNVDVAKYLVKAPKTVNFKSYNKNNEKAKSK